MKIALVNEPWIVNEEKYGVKAGSRWANVRLKNQNMSYYPFPFNMAYTTALLRREGFDAAIKDGIAEELSKEQVMNWIRSEKPDFVLIETSTPSISNDLEFAKKVKDSVGAKIILAGTHATALPKEMLKHKQVDFVALGEYEYTILELMKEANKKKPSFKKIRGLCSKSKDNAIINPRREPIQNLDELPFPERDELPIYKYNDPFCKKFPNVPMTASRGCPFHCIYCLEPSVFYGKPYYRARDPERVVDEMELLIQKYKVREVYFDDSSLTLNKEYVRKLCYEVLRRKVKINWSCMADARTDFETLKLMKKSGCIGLKFGVETANPEMLKTIRKPLNLDTVRRFVRYCNKLGLYSHGTYMFGLPGETRETIKRTIDFAFSVGSTSSQFAIATPLPGTDFYKMARENKWLTTEDWSKYEGGCSPVIEYPNLKAKDLQEAIEYAKRRRMVQILNNPRVAAQYLLKMYKMNGPAGFIKEVSEKTKFLLKK